MVVVGAKDVVGGTVGAAVVGGADVTGAVVGGATLVVGAAVVGGRVVVAEGTSDYYGDGWDHLVCVLRIADGRVVRSNFYFASQLEESPAYHARWSTPADRPIRPERRS